jgi:perosamine synthetase
MRRSISHSRPCVGLEEQKACARVIARRQLSQNGEVSSLETEVAALAGHRYGAAVSSGTAALFLALKSLGVTKNHGVVIPSYVCTALLNAVNFIGAKPLLADVDPATGAMTPGTAEKAIRKNTGAIIVPHLFGYPAGVTGIAGLGLPVIEDCAQCIGTETSSGRRVGSLSRLSIFSFYATKLIGAGEGGMVASSDRKIVDGVIAQREYDNREKYTMGFNFKMSEIQAAIARIQVGKLSRMIRKRRSLALHYQKLLAPFHPLIELPAIGSGVSPVYFRFVVLCGSALLRDTIIGKMDAVGIGCRKPVFRPLHRYCGLRGFPGTDAFHDRALSLPIYPDLELQDVEFIVHHLKKIIGRERASSQS